MRITLRVLVVSLLLLVATGCGSSHSAKPSTNSPPPVAPPSGPTRAEWAAQVDAICARALKQLNGFPWPKSYQQFAQQLGLAEASFNRVVTQTEAVKPPPADAARVRRLLVAMRGNVSTLQRAHEAALNQDQKALEAAVKSGKAPALRSGQLAYELGLTKCSQPVG
jgi:hypothetical protein